MDMAALAMILAATPVATAPIAVQLVIPPPAPAPLPITDDALLALGSAQERLTVPVSINQRGPWNFIIDTGSERTVVSRELAGVLGLSAGPRVRVTAITGSVTTGSVIVPALSVSRISRETIQAPALEASDMGAQGMLGVDALQGHAVEIDFAKRRMTLKPARKRARGAGVRGDDIVVTAKSLYGQLILTDAYWRSRRIAVIVDTGSPVTIGNPALLRAMTRRPRAVGKVSVISATGDTLHAQGFTVDDFSIGGIGFRNVAMAFADAAPFRRFGLQDTPALLLGLDSMRLFRAVRIDFANREVTFRLPRDSRMGDAMIKGLTGGR